MTQQEKDGFIDLKNRWNELKEGLEEAIPYLIDKPVWSKILVNKILIQDIIDSELRNDIQ